MKITTKLARPNPKSQSLRTSVPSEVRNALDLNEDSQVDWILKAVDNKSYKILLDINGNELDSVNLSKKIFVKQHLNKNSFLLHQQQFSYNKRRNNA